MTMKLQQFQQMESNSVRGVKIYCLFLKKNFSPAEVKAAVVPTGLRSRSLRLSLPKLAAEVGAVLPAHPV